MILISLTSHENAPFLLMQLENIFKVVQDCCIVVHLNKDFKDAFLNLYDERYKNRLFINPNSYNSKRASGMIVYPHVSNFLYMKEHKFSHICLAASNELFFRPNLTKYVNNYDIGLLQNPTNVFDIYGNKKLGWIWQKPILEDKKLINFFNNINIDIIYTSWHEGSFFRKQIFEEILTYCEKFLQDVDYLFNMKYPLEEILFPTIFRNKLNHKNCSESPNYCEIVSNAEVPIYSIYLLNSALNKQNIYSIKGFARDQNNPVVTQFLKEKII